MGKINDERTPRGSDFTKSRRPYRARRRVTKKAQAVAKLVRLVEQRLSKKPLGVKNGTPKSHIAWSENGIYMYAGHGPDTWTFLPITWAIPSERLTTDPPDDRFRTGNRVYLKGIRIRFLVKYTGSFRMRFFVYQEGAGHPSVSFHQTLVPGHNQPQANAHPRQGFRLTWGNPSLVVPYGPMASWPIRREEGLSVKDNVFVLESPDSTPFTADLAKGESRPLGTLTVSDSDDDKQGHTSSSGTRWREVDWYCPIERTILYTGEVHSSALNAPYLVGVYYDVPTLYPMKEPSTDAAKVAATTAVTSPIQLKYYYR